MQLEFGSFPIRVPTQLKFSLIGLQSDYDLIGVQSEFLNLI